MSPKAHSSNPSPSYMSPAHSTCPIGQSLPGDYFSPGVTIIRGVAIGSPWAIAYWAGQSFTYERAGIGAPWVRTK